MELSREELIETGRSVPTGVLREWASNQLAAARKLSERLEHRGVSKSFLSEVGGLLESVQKAHVDLERTGQQIDPRTSEFDERVLDQAVDFWREVKQIAKIEFARDPDTLARYRTSVRVGPSASKLAGEIERALPLLREHRGQVGWLGVDDPFIKKGEALVGQLREIDGRQREVVRSLPPANAEAYRQKGRLLDLTRKLVRIGQLEFRNDPRTAAQFNYDALRAGGTFAATPRTRAEKARTED